MVAYGPSVGSMLASNADRERAIDVLRAGFAEGRLTQDEFNERVARVQESRTYDQLAAQTRDLPAGPWGGLVPVSYHNQAVPYRDRAVQGPDPSFANLALTAVVMFALAAIVTALAIYAHMHGQAFGTNMNNPTPAIDQPYVRHFPHHP
ncbi:MAG TPA: DUF1707 domain-containing protein [Streptosporangiaceae bacterium]